MTERVRPREHARGGLGKSVLGAIGLQGRLLVTAFIIGSGFFGGAVGGPAVGGEDARRRPRRGAQGRPPARPSTARSTRCTVPPPPNRSPAAGPHTPGPPTNSRSAPVSTLPVTPGTSTFGLTVAGDASPARMGADARASRSSRRPRRRVPHPRADGAVAAHARPARSDPPGRVLDGPGLAGVRRRARHARPEVGHRRHGRPRRPHGTAETAPRLRLEGHAGAPLTPVLDGDVGVDQVVGVAAARSALGGDLLSVELGNELDHVTDLTPAAYYDTMTRYRAALDKAGVHVAMAGPSADIAKTNDELDRFVTAAAADPSRPELAELTSHWYPTGHCGTANATIGALLSADTHTTTRTKLEGITAIGARLPACPW